MLSDDCHHHDLRYWRGCVVNIDAGIVTIPVAIPVADAGVAIIIIIIIIAAVQSMQKHAAR